MIRRTAMKRAKIKGLLRNLMVVAGNSGLPKLLPKLRRFLKHEDEHVSSHARWAIEQLEKGEQVNGAGGARQVLNRAESSGAQF